MLREVAPSLWVTERPLRFLGAEIGCRMTVVRLEDGALFLHSPVALDEGLRKELDQLGPVRFAVAPNKMHHLYAGGVAETYPDSLLYVAPGLDEKRPDLDAAGVLGDEAPEAWAGQLDQVFFQGFPMANEIVFLHRATRTLIVTDIAFNPGPPMPAISSFLLRLGGARGLSPSYAERLLIRDRAAARPCLEKILSWDFDRVIVSHGTIVESGGREALRAGYDWLLN